MFPWWKKKVPLIGVVLFRGTLAPRADEFACLVKLGVTVKPLDGGPGAPWRLTLVHPQWGEAELGCAKGMPVLPRELLEYARLTPQEKQDALAGGVAVMIKMDPSHENLLRDRKRLLRYLRAVLGDSGVASLDATSYRVWSRDALDDELQHDADLDVEGLFSVHAVTGGDDDKPYWMHTHGLGEIGGFDFDIVEPSEDIFGGRVGPDIFRALAFAIVERRVEPNTPRFVLASPGGEVGFVEIGAFLKRAPRRVIQQLAGNTDEFHLKNHAVLCESGRGGFLGWLFGPKAEPSRFLSSPVPDEIVLQFSTEASDLMAERARRTYAVFRRLAAEMREFQFPVLAKMGYRVDGGGQDAKEHLWFEVHECLDDAVDATLANTPFNIERMKAGDRGKHPIELLSDWTILTPAGSITPRDLLPARLIRPHREELREAMKAAKAGS